MKHFLALFLTLFLAFAVTAQTGQSLESCEGQYAFLCDEDLRLSRDILAQEELLKRMRCRKDEISKEKQKAISCMAAYKNKAELDEFTRRMRQLLLDLEAAKNKPVSLPVPCPSGNCN